MIFGAMPKTTRQRRALPRDRLPLSAVPSSVVLLSAFQFTAFQLWDALLRWNERSQYPKKTSQISTTKATSPTRMGALAWR